MLYPEIIEFLNGITANSIDSERREKWNALAQRLRKKDNQGAINFICTHNARRSVISQSLASALAHHHGLTGIKAWSGGAEETFVHPNSIKLLLRIGYRLKEQTTGENPRYTLSYAEGAPDLLLFSKKFDDPSSPAPYHAILVCSKGDAACPFIPNVASRTLIPFEDPGAFDNTPKADEAYYEAATLIGDELKQFFQLLIK